MKVAVFAYSAQGCRTARRVLNCYKDSDCRAFTMERLAGDGFAPIPRPSAAFYGEQFAWADALIFVGSCGIAVRIIAPYIKDKQTDPAVLCVDELAQYVIPLLSGHIGGANEQAQALAAYLQAAPIITTATDINRKFSVDAWATRHGYVIDSMDAAKAVSAAILERLVPLTSDFPIVGALPAGVVAGETGELGIYLTCRTREPFDRTLRLIPKVLTLGIGCRKGIAKEAVAEAVERVLAEHGIDRRAVAGAASIDLKKDEQGLWDFCRETEIPVSFYTADELRAVEGDFTASAFVKSVTGVDNVCERAALLGAHRLIVKKTAHNGVTVAVAEKFLEVHFG